MITRGVINLILRITAKIQIIAPSQVKIVKWMEITLMTSKITKTMKSISITFRYQWLLKRKAAIEKHRLSTSNRAWDRVRKLKAITISSTSQGST